MTYQVRITKYCAQQIRGLPKSAREKAVNKLRLLDAAPEQRGKPLLGQLKGLYTIPLAGRYRGIYRIDKDDLVVFVLTVGIRREDARDDVYVVAERLFRQILDRPRRQ